MPERGMVVVSGASSGIGAAIAVRLAEAGFVVVGLSRRGKAPTPASGRVIAISCDVSVEEARVRAFEQVAEIDDAPLVGLVNGAGYQIQTPSSVVPIDEVREILETNLIGALRLSQLAYPLLADHGGLIVNIGSFYAKLGVPNFLAYSASKAALEAMTRTLAVEWAPEGISVINIAPGYVETALNEDYLAVPGNRERLARKVPMRRLGSPTEVATLTAMLFDQRVPFLTGETIYLDGAQGVSL